MVKLPSRVKCIFCGNIFKRGSFTKYSKTYLVTCPFCHRRFHMFDEDVKLYDCNGNDVTQKYERRMKARKEKWLISLNHNKTHNKINHEVEVIA